MVERWTDVMTESSLVCVFFSIRESSSIPTKKATRRVTHSAVFLVCVSIEDVPPWRVIEFIISS